MAVQQRRHDRSGAGRRRAQRRHRGGGKQSTIGSTITIVVGVLIEPTTTETDADNADDADDHDRADDHHHAMSSRNGRVRVAVVMGGRSSEHDISLASARSVLESLDPDKYEAVTVEIDRQGQWQLGSGGQRELPAGRAAETLPVPTGWLRPGHAGRRGRGLPHPPRPVRRGRHRPGAARAGRRPLRRRRRRRLGALHGQGPVQVGHARPRHPGRPQRHAARRATRSRTRSGTPSS